MSKKARREKNSCRWKENKTLLPAGSVLCNACFEIESYNVKFWNSKNISTDGKCFVLHPNNAPKWKPQDPDNKLWSGRELSYVSLSTIMTGETSIAPRIRGPPNSFVAEPSIKPVKMFSEKTRDSWGRRQKQVDFQRFRDNMHSLTIEKKHEALRELLDLTSKTAGGRTIVAQTIASDNSVAVGGAGNSRVALRRQATSMRKVARGLATKLAPSNPEKMLQFLRTETPLKKQGRVDTVAVGLMEDNDPNLDGRVENIPPDQQSVIGRGGITFETTTTKENIPADDCCDPPSYSEGRLAPSLGDAPDDPNERATFIRANLQNMLESDDDDDDDDAAPRQAPPKRHKRCRHWRKSMQWSNEAEKKRKLANLQADCGNKLAEFIKSLTTASDRRPFLSSLSKKHNRKTLCNFFDLNINRQEWNNIKIHEKYPGQFKPVWKEAISRMKVDTKLLEKLLYFLDSPGNLQMHAYNTGIREIIDGNDWVLMDNVARMKKIETLTRDFIQSLMVELTLQESGAILPENRCPKLEGVSLRRCLHEHRHSGKCKFTNKGELSVSLVNDLIKSLTSGDLKSMSGLDDVRVQKGRDNWQRLREISAEVFPLGVNDSSTKSMSKRIDKVELFYKTDYVPHLAREGSHKCNCMTCGFHSDETPQDIQCSNRNAHLPSCTQCSEGFSIILELQTVIEDKLDALRKSFAKTVDPIDDADLDPTTAEAGGDPIHSSFGGQNFVPTATTASATAVTSSGPVRPAPSLLAAASEVPSRSTSTAPQVPPPPPPPPATAAVPYCSPCIPTTMTATTSATNGTATTSTSISISISTASTSTSTSTSSVNDNDTNDNWDDDDNDSQPPVEERLEQEVGDDPVVVDPNAPPPNSWESFKVYELRDECRQRGLPVSGNKKVLIDRILNFQDDEDEDVDDQSPADKLGKLSKAQLVDECKRRNISTSGNKLKLIETIIADMDTSNAVVEGSTIPLRDLTVQELLLLQKYEELANEISLRLDDLKEYRSHLARHKSEEEYARSELENLADDEAIVTSDYKMKILSCFFRENQKKWFGKRGTTLLGFMITTNSTNQEEKEKGLKDVSFVMMVTDDVLQDEHEVASAKAIVYKEYLPPHIKKVRFTSDGAGCFKSQLHRALQPFWKLWVGIDEVLYRITPAGDGKSRLDGMFGRLNSIMASAVNMGASYWNAETCLEAMEKSNGLSSTQFVLFAPDRSLQIHAIVKMNLEAVLLTTLDPDRQAGNNTTIAYKHSGFGCGSPIDPTAIQFSLAETDDGKKQKKNDSTPLHNVYNTDGTINQVLVQRLIPKCILNQARENAKGHLQSRLSLSEEGKSSRTVRADKKKGRIQARVEKKKESIEDRREAMRAAGLFLCNARCPKTKRYCCGKFLLKSSSERHEQKQNHSFLTGIRARDYVLLAASKVGGLVSFGERPDRNSKSSFKTITPAIDGSDAEVAAHCHGNFNRKEKVKGYVKPKKLLDVLETLYNEEPKLRAKEMRDRMKGMTDVDGDGGLLFCSSKQNTNGLLLSEDQIQSWINQRTQKKKKATKEPTEKEKQQAALVKAAVASRNS